MVAERKKILENEPPKPPRKRRSVVLREFNEKIEKNTGKDVREFNERLKKKKKNILASTPKVKDRTVLPPASPCLSPIELEPPRRPPLHRPPESTQSVTRRSRRRTTQQNNDQHQMTIMDFTDTSNEFRGTSKEVNELIKTIHTDDSKDANKSLEAKSNLKPHVNESNELMPNSNVNRPIELMPKSNVNLPKRKTVAKKGKNKVEKVPRIEYQRLLKYFSQGSYQVNAGYTTRSGRSIKPSMLSSTINTTNTSRLPSIIELGNSMANDELNGAEEKIPEITSKPTRSRRNEDAIPDSQAVPEKKARKRKVLEDATQKASGKLQKVRQTPEAGEDSLEAKVKKPGRNKKEVKLSVIPSDSNVPNEITFKVPTRRPPGRRVGRPALKVPSIVLLPLSKLTSAANLLNLGTLQISSPSKQNCLFWIGSASALFAPLTFKLLLIVLLPLSKLTSAAGTFKAGRPARFLGGRLVGTLNFKVRL